MKKKISMFLALTMAFGAATPAFAGTKTAMPTQQKVLVEGAEIAFASYNIDGYNYFMLRDLSASMKYCQKNFNVEYNAQKDSVEITTMMPYPKGSDDISKYTKAGSQTAVPTRQSVFIDGKQVELEAYTILGYNYCKLRDLAVLLDFAVDYNTTDSIVYIETDRTYAQSDTFGFPVVVYPSHTGTITTQMAIDDIVSIIGPGGPEHWVIEGHHNQKDWQQLLTDPYSSAYLTNEFDIYKEYKDFQTFIVGITYWLAGGGDDWDTAAKGEIFG